jgi:hypothetical protein
MKLFQGLAHSDYQDVLRALGYFIDENGYVDVRIVESDDGLVFQGRSTKRPSHDSKSPFDTFLITDGEIKEMVRGSYKRRTK